MEDAVSAETIISRKGYEKFTKSMRRYSTSLPSGEKYVEP